MTESLFASGGYNTPPSTSPFLPVAPYDLVAKDYHQSIAFSQGNSIFVQSQTGFSSISKKTETCFGRWEQHSTLEPLHIQVPPLPMSAGISIKTEGLSCGSSRGSSTKFDDLTPQSHSGSSNYHLPLPPPSTSSSSSSSSIDRLSTTSNVNGVLHSTSSIDNNESPNTSSDNNITPGSYGRGGLVTTMPTGSPTGLTTTSVPTSSDLINGCSRTIPISWSSSASSSSLSSSSVSSTLVSSSLSAATSSSSSCLPVSAISTLTTAPTQLVGRSIGPVAITSSGSSELTTSFPENLSIHSQNHQQHHHNHNQQQHHATVNTPSSATVSSTSSLTLLQIKREPCQVSEITTSNNIGHYQQQQYSSHNHHNRGGNTISSAVVAPSTTIGIGSAIGTPAILPGTVAESSGGGGSTTAAIAAVVKVESPSPKSHTGSNNNTVNMDNQTISASQNSANAIPVGIAVARQRLQEHTTVTHHQPKEINRFGIGIADMGGTTVNSQNMYFTGTNSTMIPLSSEALSMGVSNVQNAVRTPPTFWQYPTPVPVESMLPMPIPPVGFQLVRDPNTGQYLFLPATATIEPFQPTVVWPTYPQPTAALQPPHLLLPPLAQSLQPPPLAPLQLLGSDYLTTASTTLHQHTQTHSTRFVALTADAKRKSVPGPTVPLPIPHHAVIKIEDCNSGSSTTTGTGAGTTTTHHHQQSATIFGDAQFYYHQPPTAGLIQIAPSQGHPQAATTIQECNSLMPSISPPPLAVPAVLPPPPSSSPKISTCVASPVDQSISENLEASTSCVPEVQDATIQTDTPIGSEDDNTADGIDECSLPSQEVDENRGTVGTAVSLHHIHREFSPSSECHNVTSNVTEDDYVESAVSGMTTTQNDAEVDSSRNDSGFDSNAVTSTNSLEEATNVITTDHQWCSNSSASNNSTLQIDENIIEGKDLSLTTNAIISNIKQQHQVTSTPVDLSGLELLSNISIEAIEKKITFIKQEPLEDKKPVNILTSIEMNMNQTDEPNNQTLQNIHQSKIEDEQNLQRNDIDNDIVNQHEQLGGLNLLCALAEQRIQEEVGKRHRKRSSSSSESHGSAKKKKHKHSKSNKKDRKEKRRNKQQLMEDISITEEQDDVLPEGEVLTQNIKETFRRVKAKYSKCSTCKGEGDSHCCKEKCDWPTPEELMLAMETDMRLRLADITRQCQEKKRELEEICPIIQQKKQQNNLLHQPILQFSDRESTPLSSKGSIRSFKIEKLHQQQQNTQKSLKFTCESPSLSESNGILSIAADIAKTSSDTESSKFEDVETCSSSSSKRKGGIPRKHDDSNTETIVAKKPKSLVGYILASKNRTTENSGKDTPSFLTDETTVFSELSYRLKVSAFNNSGIANSLQSTGSPSMNLTNVFSTIKQEPTEESDKPINQFINDDNSTPQTQSILSPSVFSYEKIYHRKSSKHHSKHKKSKSGNKEKKRRRSSEIKERKRKIDARCTLTSEHLDKDKTRVLTAMGGLFYAGYLSPLQPPDVYAVTLDGERGNRPHIMSCEEVLRDAILEVSPSSVEECPPGTRLCAYWSQQYRCLYPGTAAEPGTPDIVNDRKFISVEFDDGDSGRIALEDIRFLLSDYPIVEYDPNPLLSLGKRKRRISHHNQSDQSSQAITNLTSSSSIMATPSTSGNGGGVAVSSGPGIKTKVTLPSYYNTSRGEEKNKLQTALDKEERRKLKKMKKERLKKLELDLSEGGGGSSGNGISGNSSSDRKHKKKHKCNDENCKHRKHKKRKKHKKHHHRENSSNTADSSQDIEYSQGDGIEENEEQLQNLMVNADNDNLTGLLTTAKLKNREELQEDSEEVNNKKQTYSLILNGQGKNTTENIDVVENNNKEMQNGKKIEKETVNNFTPDLKDDTMTEEDVASSITESSGSVYEPKKKKERQNSTSVDNHSKIAAFLPARQLWAWAGKGHKRQTKGRARKQFYKSIQRGKETISVGDSAVFLSTGRPDRPYIGRIECMWETSSSNKVVRVRWFYHPEETVGCPNLKFPGALFESLHEDENDVQTISHKCEVLSLDAYTKKFGQDPKQYQSIYDNNDTYYLAGYYDPTAQNLKLQTEIPTLAENDKWV